MARLLRVRPALGTDKLTNKLEEATAAFRCPSVVIWAVPSDRTDLAARRFLRKGLRFAAIQGAWAGVWPAEAG